jgi:TonB family protein
LIEWTDSNLSNTTFEGTARELLRVSLNTRIHTLADLEFNPSARRGDSEWRVLYIGSGDGGSGEAKSSIRMNPQRLDTLVGKVLRIIPDLAEHRSTSTLSDNGRYRIPNDNPFVSVEGARKEVWAYGFRNPHRLHFAVDPANPGNNRLIADSVGLHTWETVNIVHKGANYGYSQREGNETLQPDNRTTNLPDDDKIPVQITDTITRGTVTPTYPVIQYGHVKGGGDAIGVTLVSTVPLPANPVQTQNVLANESKGLSQSLPKPEVKEPEAIPIPDASAKKKPKTETTPTHQKPQAQPEPVEEANNVVPFGQGGPVSGPYGVFSAGGAKGGFGVTGGGGDFGSRYAWYVRVVQQKVSENWLKYEVDPRIAEAQRVYITFDVVRDGRPANVQVEQSSGVPSLDQSAVRAIQRIDTFGPLPSDYSGNKVSVEFWFDYKR